MYCVASSGLGATERKAQEETYEQDAQPRRTSRVSQGPGGSEGPTRAEPHVELLAAELTS